jgi:hypothetical protein
LVGNLTAIEKQKDLANLEKMYVDEQKKLSNAKEHFDDDV